jgi:plastocyanin
MRAGGKETEMRRIGAGIVVGLAVAATLLVAGPATAGGFCRGPATHGDGTTVGMGGKEGCFSPTVLRAPSGATVTFVNDDPAAHTVTGIGPWGPGHEELGPGERVRVTFDRDGVYVYTCLLHPGMAGAIVIGDATGPGPAEGAAVDVEPVEDAPATEAVLSDADEVAAEARAMDPAPIAVAVVVGAVTGGLGFGLGRRRRLP